MDRKDAFYILNYRKVRASYWEENFFKGRERENNLNFHSSQLTEEFSSFPAPLDEVALPESQCEIEDLLTVLLLYLLYIKSFYKRRFHQFITFISSFSQVITSSKKPRERNNQVVITLP